MSSIDDSHPEFITVVTTFLELPFDLGLDLVHTWTYETAPPWRGWDATSMAARIGAPAPLPPDMRPQYRLAFRRVPSRGRRANEAVEWVFRHWLEPNPSFRQRAARTARHLLDRIRGNWENRTVVALTHYRDARARERQEQDGAGSGVHDAVLVLNDFLTAYGLVSDDPLIGPLSLTDLPSEAPIFGEADSMEGPVALRRVVQVHAWAEPLLNLPRDEDDVDRAAIVFDMWHRLRDPTFPTVSMLHNATRDMVAGRDVQAVISAGTAIEVLVEGTLRRTWELVGLEPDRLAGALKSGFRNQLETHLPRVISQEVNIHDPRTAPGRWWATGYQLRNEVVHHAYRPSSHETNEAVLTAFELAAYVGRALERRPQTRAAMGLLPTQRIHPKRYSFLVDP